MRLRSSSSHTPVQAPKKQIAGIRLLHDVDDGELEDITMGMEDLMDAETGSCADDTDSVDDNTELGYEAEGSDGENEDMPVIDDYASSDEEYDDDDEEEGPIRSIGINFMNIQREPSLLLMKMK